MRLFRARALFRSRHVVSLRLIQMDMGAEMKAGEALAKYTTDLTEIARSGRSDPIIGRSKEIQRTIQVLSRRTKNNPLLLGQPGTGKTALVEGLAQRIASGDVPDSVKDKKVLSLDLSAVVAGAAFKGEFEKRFKALISDVIAQSGNVILFADEIHQLVGMGASGAGAPMDAANIIKPALAKGDLHLLGATTFEEYRKYIESDSALSRRFQPVFVSEPTVEDTIAILRGIKDKYELWHGVRITDSAVVAASKLAKRYLTERKLPDSAIDLMDEAASRLRMEKESKPEDLASLEREIMILQIELAALKKETDQESFERRSAIEAILKTKQKRSEEMNHQWQIEKDRRHQAISVREKLEESRHELDQAQSRGDYAKAGEFKYSIIPKLESQVHSLLPLLLSESVTDQSVATVVSQQTGVTASRLLEGESQRLLHMEEALKKRVVGQDQAIAAVCNAVRVSRAGLHAPTKPIGSFLFLGGSGCGKTELAKALAEFLFDQDSAIVRLDMTEYSEPHSVSRLIGAPPGYVGYDEGGQLTEPIRLRPFSVILLDEIEKAHRQVTNVLLQVLDEGRLTDGSGRTVDFRNTLLIMTSNLGGGSSTHLTIDAVRGHFPPEFINRLDETIHFNSLKMKDMIPICDIQLNRITSMTYAEKRIKLEISEDAKAFLAKEGYQPEYGARPLRRVLQREILNPLAKLLLSGAAGKEDTVRVSLSGSTLKFDVNHKERIHPGKEMYAPVS